MNSVQWTILLLSVALLPVNGYPILLSLRPWWTQPAGQALFIKAVANAAVIDGSLLTWLFGPAGIFEWTRVIGLVLFNVGVWYLFAVLALTPRRRGDKDAASSDVPLQRTD